MTLSRAPAHLLGVGVVVVAWCSRENLHGLGCLGRKAQSDAEKAVQVSVLLFARGVPCEGRQQRRVEQDSPEPCGVPSK